MGLSSGQKLIQPLNKLRLTASMKNASYKSTFGSVHYGIDCADAVTPFDRTVWGMGDGTILDCGMDNVFGNYLVIKYPRAYNHKEKRYADLIVRLYHLNSYGNCHPGMAITKDTKLGEYGDTGLYVSGKHLHIEVDEDTVYTHYTPTISGNSSKFKGSNSGANDKTMSNPLDWMHCKTSAKDYQTYTTDGTAYINSADKTTVKITEL